MSLIILMRLIFLIVLPISMLITELAKKIIKITTFRILEVKLRLCFNVLY